MSGRASAKVIARRGASALLAAIAVLLALSSSANAQYFRRPVSNIDPRVMQIDEKAVLGAKLDADVVLRDENGRPFKWGDMLGKPLILVLAYYACDGSCSIINANLKELLGDVKAVAPGEDFRILTLSFDRKDTAQTTRDFRSALGIDAGLAANWSFATFEREEDLKVQTDRIGFKFFWSPEDRIFLHPGAFLFFSPEGRLVRVLYQEDVSARDIELAVLDARQGQFRMNEIVKLALSVCYSYSFADGKYRLSLPIFIGLGSFILGIGLLFGSMAVYKSSRFIKLARENNHA